MSAHNSISQLLEQFLELNTNSLETFERINEAITTDKENVAITLYDNTTGETKPITIPAFGYLKREIERLDNNLKSLSGSEGGANIRLKDGSFRRIHAAKLKGPSKSIKTLISPVNFNTKLNDFFEDFLNPLLTIELNVDGQIPVGTERVYVERFLFDSNDAATSLFFDETFKGAGGIDYANFKYKSDEAGVKYSLDSNIVDMPIRSIQYSGGFDVIDIINTQKTLVVDGVTETKSIKLFTLNKLSYSDSTKVMNDTETLKVGDSLVVNTESYSTRYLVNAIDSSKSQVELKLIEGFEAIRVGANSLKIHKGIEGIGINIDINIGYNERQVVFVKPIDPDSKIMADNYSPGIGFYSNELTMITESGESTTLAKYYKDEVADFGQFIKALKVDYIPPAAVALKPNAPRLDVDNFKVVQINKHLTDNATTKKIVKLKSDKKSAEQSIKKTDSAIKRKRTFITKKIFKSTSDKNRHRGELSALINKRSDHSKMFASLVSDIKATAESTQVSAVKPKFRTRGFWSVPAPKTLGEEVSQDIIQFVVRYRYLSNNGASSTIEQIQFNDDVNNTIKTGAFSNWIEKETSVKKRRFNEITEKYEWYFESEEDGSAVNFNSLDIPLSPGETVEVIIKSVSEAGYPANPVSSEWSDPVKIEFPEEFSIDSVTGLVESNERDSIKVEIIDDLESKGVYSHVGDSTEEFSHTANSIASGFLSPEQKPISLYDKLIEMQMELERLRELTVAAVGELVVKIIDEAGNISIVDNNSSIKLFGGYYVQEVSDADDYKGEIITKIFKLELSNNKATQLELTARINGNRNLEAYSSQPASTTYGGWGGGIDLQVSTNEYYKDEGQYDIVPVGYQNVENIDLDAGQFFNKIPSQSSQTIGQFIYSRFKNLSNDKQLYDTAAETYGGLGGFDETEHGVDLDYYGLTSGLSGSATTPNDWTTMGTAAMGANATGVANAGAWDTIQGSTTPANDPINYDDNIFISHFHPMTDYMPIETIISNGHIGMPDTATRYVGESSTVDPTIQTPFKRIFGSISNVLGTASYRRAVKTSFINSDKYTLGGKSCGSFLYLSPVDKHSLSVDADNKFGKKRIDAGDSGSIQLDLVWQYRMTDYYGTSATGKGKIGGLKTNPINNITYSKTVGFDIISSGDRFSFDVEVTSTYKPVGNNIQAIPSVSIQNF